MGGLTKEGKYNDQFIARKNLLNDIHIFLHIFMNANKSSYYF